MPRDASGNFTLVAGNPVDGGTVIEPLWANPTLADIAVGLTDSLDRNGNGNMNVGLQYSDGARGAPGITWADEPASGFRRAGQFDQRTVIAANDVTRHIQATGVVGQQNPHEIWDGEAFKPTLIGHGGAKENPQFQIITVNNLIADSGDFGNAGSNSRDLVVNGVVTGMEFAWAYVTGATATVTNSRNISTVTRFGVGFYRVVLSQPMGSGSDFGGIMYTPHNTGVVSGVWTEETPSQFVIRFYNQANNLVDVNFSVFVPLDYV